MSVFTRWTDFTVGDSSDSEEEHKTIGTHVWCEADGKWDSSESEVEQKTIGTHIWSEADGKAFASVELGSAPKPMPIEMVSEATLPPKDGKIGVSKPIGTHTWCEADGKLNDSTVLGEVFMPKPTSSAKPCAIENLPAAASGPKQVLTLAAAQKLLSDYLAMSDSFRAIAYGGKNSIRPKSTTSLP